jgi:hypothetical protein
MELSPKEYGLNSRIKLIELGTNHLGINKLIKSRIIQKDTVKLIEIAEKIKIKNPAVTISLICHNNICSKSVKLLKEQGIEIHFSN